MIPPSPSTLPGEQNRSSSIGDEALGVSIQDLNKKCRELERQIELDLNSYDLEEEPNSLLTKFNSTNGLIDKLVDSIHRMRRIMPDSHYVLHHREKLKYYRQGFTRLKNSFAEKREKDRLLGSTRIPAPEDDISISMNTMLKDEMSVQNSLETTSSIIEVGKEVRRVLQRGENILLYASNRLQNLAFKFKKVDQAMQVIRRAKLRNKVILGLAIGFCLSVYAWIIIV